MNDKEKPEKDAEVFVKGVKRQTRKKFTAEEKIRMYVFSDFGNFIGLN